VLPLDPDDPRPPYAQVVDIIRREIELGVLPPGKKLPTHQEMSTFYRVSVGTIKRAIGELQGAGLVISRQGQGVFVRTRRTLLEAVPHTFSAETIAGPWVTYYQFKTEAGVGYHADITHVSPQSSRRLTAVNFPPDPATKGHHPAFRNEIEAQLANRHLVGNWRNVSDTRYFGTLHLALLPGEAIMEGYYTSFLTDVQVDVGRWSWVRLDPHSVAGADLAQVRLKDPEQLREFLDAATYDAPLSLSAIAERSS
jgi:DNA-binding transcriptional regulator YhcF (GntR family)